MVYKFSAIRTVVSEAERRRRLAQLFAVFEEAPTDHTRQDVESAEAEATPAEPAQQREV